MNSYLKKKSPLQWTELPRTLHSPPPWHHASYHSFFFFLQTLQTTGSMGSIEAYDIHSLFTGICFPVLSSRRHECGSKNPSVRKENGMAWGEAVWFSLGKLSLHSSTSKRTCLGNVLPSPGAVFFLMRDWRGGSTPPGSPISSPVLQWPRRWCGAREVSSGENLLYHTWRRVLSSSEKATLQVCFILVKGHFV